MKSIQPSITRNIFSTLLNFGIPGILFLVMVIFVGVVVQISTVIEALAFLNLGVSSTGLFLLLVLVVLGIMLGATLLNLVSTLGMRLDIYDSYVEFVHGVKHVKIPYENISQLTYSKKGLAGLLGCSTIYVRTTNMEDLHTNIPYVVDAELKVHEVDQKRLIHQRTLQTYQRMDVQGW